MTRICRICEFSGRCDYINSVISEKSTPLSVSHPGGCRRQSSRGATVFEVERCEEGSKIVDPYMMFIKGEYPDQWEYPEGTAIMREDAS